MSLTSILVIAGAITVFLAFILLLMAKFYCKVGPNQVLVISGGRKRTVEDVDGRVKKVGYRLHLGGGTFLLPFIEKADTLPLDVVDLPVKTPEVLTSEGVPIMVDATAQVKVKSDDQSIRKAAEQFLACGIEGIRKVAGNVIEGQVRSLIGTKRAVEIFRGRREFGEDLEKLAQKDFDKMGLELISFALKDISDNQGYLESMGKPEIAAVKRDATVAQAEAEKDALIKSAEAKKLGDIAKLKAEAEIAKIAWENDAKKSMSQMEVHKVKAKADLSYDLERYKVSQEVKREEYNVKRIEKEEAIKVEEQEVLRKEKELEATVVKPAQARKLQEQAEADAQYYRMGAESRSRATAIKAEGEANADKTRLQGEAEAEAMHKKAQAWSNYNQAAIYQMVMDVLPELAKSVSEPLSKVDKIVVFGGQNGDLGTSKVTREVSNILTQLPDLVEAMTGVDIKKILQDKLQQTEEE